MNVVPLIAVLLSAAPPSPEPAREVPSLAVKGFHGLAQLDTVVSTATFQNAYSAFAASEVQLAPQFGFDVGSVHLAAGARWAFGWEYTRPDNAAGTRMSASDIGLVFSAPELAATSDGRFTLTPTVGAIVPVHFPDPATALSAQLRGNAFLDVFRASVILDVSKSLELAPRPPPTTDANGIIFLCGGGEVNCNAAPYSTTTIAPRAIAEFLPVPELPRTGRGTSSQSPEQPVRTTGFRTSRSAELYVTWRFAPLFGGTLSVADSGPTNTFDGRINLPFLGPYPNDRSLALRPHPIPSSTRAGSRREHERPPLASVARAVDGSGSGSRTHAHRSPRGDRHRAERADCLHHRQLSPLPATAMVIAPALAMLATLFATDVTRRQQRITTALLCVPALLALIAGTLAAPHQWLSFGAFVLAVFLAVFLRRFGPRGTALGMMTFNAFFFSLFFHAQLSELPALLAAGVGGIFVGFIVRFAVLPDRPASIVRQSMSALTANVSLALSDAAAAVTAERPAKAEHRVRRTLARLNETALTLEAEIDSAAAEDLPDPRPGSARTCSRTKSRWAG